MPFDGDVILNAGLNTDNIQDSLKSLQKTISKGLKNAIKIGFGVRSVFTLIRKLRTELIDGFKNLSQVSDPFNEAMSSMVNALAGLKSSFASAFAPLIQLVAPALTTFINLISAAVDKIGMLIAALSGQKEYIKYIPTQVDYADSVAKTGDNASKASKSLKDTKKSAKELQKTLAGFDDVEILHDNSDDNKLDDVGGGLGNLAGGDTQALKQQILSLSNVATDLAKKLKDAFKKADFTEIGRMVGDKLNSALNSINWDKINQTLNKVAKSIATFLNGFLETPGLFDTIGRTIANGINASAGAAETFITEFHWDSLGTAIHDLLLSTLTNINWDTINNVVSGYAHGIGTTINYALSDPAVWKAIFNTFAYGLNTVVDGIYTFINTVDWGTMASNMAVGLNEALLENFDWNKLADTLITLINSAFNAWYIFVTTFDFKKFGTTIGTNLSRVIRRIDWKKGGASVAQTINGLFHALNGFVETTDWKSLGKAVTDTIAGFFNEFEWSTVGEFLSNCWIGLNDALSGAMEDVDWTELPGKITTAISDFLSGFDWDGMAESVGELIGNAIKAITFVGARLWTDLVQVGKNIVAGGKAGVVSALRDIGTWIKEHLFDPFVKGIKKAFGIASPSTEMQPYGRFVIEGLLQGIINGLLMIGTWLKEHVFDPIVDGIKTLFGLDGEESVLVSVGKDVINGFLDGIVQVFTNIGTWITDNIVNPFVNGVKSVFGIGEEESLLLNIGKGLIGDLKSGITGALEGINDWVSTNIADPICNGLNAAKNKFVEVGGNLIGGLKSGISTGVDAVTGAGKSAGSWLNRHVASPIVGGVKSLFGVHSPSTVFAEIGKFLMSGLQKGIDDNSNLPQTALSTAQTSMKNVFSAVTQLLAWAKIGSDIMTIGLVAGIALKVPTLLLTITNLESDMREQIADKNTSWEDSGSSLMDSLKSGIAIINSELITEISIIADNMYNQFLFVNWYNIGTNIGVGIYNGLIAENASLKVLAWNTAVGMYNSACDALDISSPSKKFAWIGEMTMAGLSEGIEDNEDEAVDAIDSMIKNMTKQASGLQSISNAASLTLPSIAQGKVVPNSVQLNKSSEDKLSNIMDSLNSLGQNFVTKDELASLLQELAGNISTSFYIGDEQIARHANAGNARIDRRYNAVTS